MYENNYVQSIGPFGDAKNDLAIFSHVFVFMIFLFIVFLIFLVVQLLVDNEG